MTVRPIANRVNHETSELFFEHLELPHENLIGEEGACELFDAHQPCGAEANLAKCLTAKASWEAADACIQFHSAAASPAPDVGPGYGRD